VIRVASLRYTFPNAARPALDDLTFDVADGEFVVLAGASGSGKSTLARALVGLVPHFSGGEFSGSVVVGGRDTREHPARALAGSIGFVAQDPASQAVCDRVEGELVFAMENLGIPPLEMRRRLEEVLDALGIAHLRDRRLDTLSGGEQQRVAIASVLAAQPRALVLDEPTSQLDPQSAEDVLAVLARLHADLGLTVVLVEHRLERVAQYADRMIVLDDGRIVADATPRAVLANGSANTPLSRLARALGWDEVPLTVREARAVAARASVPLEPREPARAEPGETLVEARGLRVARGGAEVVRGVDLRVARGETLAVVGRNGSGKTTLLRALVGLLRPLGGERIIAGFDPARTPVEEIARRVAYVPQAADSLLFCETVRDEIKFTLRARGHERDAEAELARAGLEALASLDPRDLSAGQRLQVAMLAATAGDPDVVLLDEPTRGMDANGKDALARELEQWRARGRAVVLVTHDVELVARVATRVVLLANGEVVLDGPARDVLGGSPLFASQVNKVFGDRRLATVDDVVAALP
jgi:energy-coupling factor transport system ATP-binding protein